MSPTDDQVEEILDNLDPNKLKFQSSTRFLDRQVDITITAADDATFNALNEILDAFKKVYAEEMQRLQNIHQHSSP